MSQPPHAQFDDTVLEMIEHSPIGMVPHTPAYVDALARLYAAQKIYHSADHKDGHVTARSMAALPHFCAANLDELAAGRVEVPALESNAAIFDRYLQALPTAVRAKAETLRLKVAGKPVHHRHHKQGDGSPVIVHDPLHTLFLVPGTGPNRGLPGNYLYGSVLEGTVSPPHWTLHLHDSDDGAAVFESETLSLAVAKLHEVFDSAPFHLNELEMFGFRML